jgi:hypothetical protein
MTRPGHEPDRGRVRISAVGWQGQASRIAHWRHSLAGVVAVLRSEASHFEEELPELEPECARDVRRAAELLDGVVEHLKQVEELAGERQP